MIEKRRYQRVAYFHPVEVAALPDGPAVEAHAFDISVGGIGIAAAIGFECGQEVCIRFRFAGEEALPVEEMLGRVVYSRADEDGNRLGIEFLEIVKETTHPQLARTINAL